MEKRAPQVRVEYVDRLRGLAVLGMFLVHSPYPWVLPEINRGWYGSMISQISGMVAPVFVFLAGMGITLAARNANNKGEQAARRARKRVISRGLWIVVAGYALQLVFFACRGFSGDPMALLKVDILHCIGATMVLSALFMWPRRAFNVGALVMFIVLVVGAQVTWRLPLAQWLPDPLAGYLRSVPKMSRFPIFPYGGWMALGLLMGPLWLRFTEKREMPFWVVLALLGGFLAALGQWMEWLSAASGLTEWMDSLGKTKTTVSYFVYKAGILFVLFTVARVSSRLFDSIPFSFASLFGRTSLFSYCVHLVLIYHVFGLLWRKSLGVLEHLAAVALLSAAMYILCVLWTWGPVREIRGRILFWRQLR